MRAAHSARALLKAREWNHHSVFICTAEAGDRNEELSAGDIGCNEPVPFEDSHWEICVSN